MPALVSLRDLMKVAGRSGASHLAPGSTVLSLLAGPLCVPVLRAHADGPLRLPDLQDRFPDTAQTTLRGQVDKLRSLGALERHVRRVMPYTVENELTETGRGILTVAEAVETWLARSPQGPIELCSEPAKEAIKALVGGWESGLLGAFAARSLTLTEVNGLIPEISYPSIERRLSAMRAANQVEKTGGDSNGKPHAVTEWGRQGVGPLMTAGRCEHVHVAEAVPLRGEDVAAGLLLALPLVSLPDEQSGRCVLAVASGDGEGAGPEGPVTGIHVEIERGEVASCTQKAEPETRTWARGTAEAWANSIVDGALDGVRVGGEKPELPQAIISGLDAALRPRARRNR